MAQSSLQLSWWRQRKGKRKWRKNRSEDNQFGSGIACVAHPCAVVAGSWIAIVAHSWVAAISGFGIAVVALIGSVVKIHAPKMFICLAVLANTTPLAKVHHPLRVLARRRR